MGNWEAQQPPLYYLLMAPLYAASKHWSMVDQLFLLRGLSYCLAWIGLCIATIASLRRDDGAAVSGLSLAPALWPLLFPAWFPEMARLGNDCLVIVLAACAWIVLRTIVSSNAGWPRYAVFGAICGAGLLTKATFLPFVAAAGALFLFQLWRERQNAGFLPKLLGLLAFIGAIVAMSGWWYVEQYLETGNPIGSIDMIMLNRLGGLLAGLSQNATLGLLATGLLYLVTTFVWAAISIPPLLVYFPGYLIMALFGWGYIRHLKASGSTPVDWVPVLTLAGLLVGLINQLLVYIALYASPGMPGYYLHSFAPVLARPVERAGAAIRRSPLMRRALQVMLFLSLLFLLLAMFMQAQYFSGCANQAFIFYFNIFTSGPCATDLPRMVENLSVFAWPLLAFGLFAAGWFLMLCGAVAAMRCLHVHANEGRAAR
ncbi:MAG: hypothetical protein HY244_06270 [Rhizobiales bacterium]|nr:hypothetical protein [Hyphomicrobiales bacterium]